MSAKENVLRHLLAGGTITKIEAIYQPFGTTNLLDVIHHLRKDGYPVEKEWEKSPKGKRYAKFYLPQKDQG